MIDHKEGIIE